MHCHRCVLSHYSVVACVMWSRLTITRFIALQLINVYLTLSWRLTTRVTHNIRVRFSVAWFCDGVSGLFNSIEFCTTYFHRWDIYWEPFWQHGLQYRLGPLCETTWYYIPKVASKAGDWYTYTLLPVDANHIPFNRQHLVSNDVWQMRGNIIRSGLCCVM